MVGVEGCRCFGVWWVEGIGGGEVEVVDLLGKWFAQ